MELLFWLFLLPLLPSPGILRRPAEECPPRGVDSTRVLRCQQVNEADEEPLHRQEVDDNGRGDDALNLVGEDDQIAEVAVGQRAAEDEGENGRAEGGAVQYGQIGGGSVVAAEGGQVGRLQPKVASGEDRGGPREELGLLAQADESDDSEEEVEHEVVGDEADGAVQPEAAVQAVEQRDDLVKELPVCTAATVTTTGPH